MSKTTAPATITIKTGRTGGTCADNFKYRDTFAEVKAGDFLSESLVTDTLVYQVVKVTKATVTVRRTMTGDKFTKDTACDEGANGLAVTWEEQVINPHAETRTLRLRKDGTIRSGSHVGASPFRPAKLVDGKPARRVDYRV